MPYEDIPVVVPTFNNPTYLRSMMFQLRALTFTRIYVIDNASTYPPMLDYLTDLAKEIRVIRCSKNFGPHFILAPQNRVQLPEAFCITDPDLKFNPRLPDDFLPQLIGLTERHRIGKAGFALDISDRSRMWKRKFANKNDSFTIWEAEQGFWKVKIDEIKGNPVYSVCVDTTFSVCNQKYFNIEDYLSAVRVGGDYTARHLPWYSDEPIPAEEAAYYTKHAVRVVFGMPQAELPD
jgi:hypothetical protein